MAKLTIAAVEAEALEVDLWGDVFTLVPVTRTRGRQVNDLDRELQAVDEASEGADDVIVELMAKILDTILAPAEGKRRKPSALIKSKWQADELSLLQLTRLVENLQEAVQDRPT